MVFLGLLLGPWISVAALFRQIRGKHGTGVDLRAGRGGFERKALDGAPLLQAPVEPHFLFHALAKRASWSMPDRRRPHPCWRALIAYLRAAVPRLHETATTLGQELELVRAYLEVMHMRMPDRLQFTLQADDAARVLFCPPMTLLTLVENAVRHGIDPSEEGGRIEVRVRLQDGRCRAEVIDSGVGLGRIADGLGTGLTNLRERLQLAFGGDAKLKVVALEPHGVRAELDFPAKRSAA